MQPGSTLNMASQSQTVSRRRALQWERDEQDSIPELLAQPCGVRDTVREYFVLSRTDDWHKTLEKYRRYQNYQRVDEQRHGKYKWVGFSEFNRDTPNELCDLEQDGHFEPSIETLLCLLEGDGRGLLSAGVPGLMGYRIRSTVAMHKRARMGTEFYGFLKLPPEIRNIVYGFALPQGTVVVPNNSASVETGDLGSVKYWRNDLDDAYERYWGQQVTLAAMQQGNRERRPVGLIQGVSRMIQNEASKVYFGGNRFILPVGPALRPSLFNSLESIRTDDKHTMERRLFRDFKEGKNNAMLVRDVSYAFDMRDKVVCDYDNLTYDIRLKDDVDKGSISPQDALRVLHDQKAFELEITWAERIDSIKWMNLNRLEISFEECYCSMGCCRKVEWVLDRFLHVGPPPGTADTEDNVYSSVNWFSRPPELIEIIGWKSKKEKKLIAEKLAKLQRESIDSTEIHLGRRLQARRPKSRLDDDDRLINRLIQYATITGTGGLE